MRRIWDVARSHPVFVATMALSRFEEILRYIGFDDRTSRPDRYRSDRFAAIREIFEEWNSNCSLSLCASKFVTVDECLYPLRNKWLGKSFNPGKPSKYGINFKERLQKLFYKDFITPSLFLF